MVYLSKKSKKNRSYERLDTSTKTKKSKECGSMMLSVSKIISEPGYLQLKRLPFKALMKKMLSVFSVVVAAEPFCMSLFLRAD